MQGKTMFSRNKFAAAFAVTAAIGLPGMTAAEDAAHPSDWYFGLSALSLGRSTPSDGAIVAANPAGTPFLTGSDFDFGMDDGLEATIGFWVSDTTAIEARFMSFDTATSYSFTTPGSFIGVGFTGPGGTAVASDYDTEFQSGELNWRSEKSDRLTVLAGLRGMDIADTMGTVLGANVATGLYEAENSLMGAQIGAQFALRNASDPFQLDLSAKVGAFANRSNAGIREFQGNNFIGEFQSDVVTETSYALEIGLTAGYQLSKNTRLTAGYQALWISDLALAADAASNSLLNPSLLNGNIYRDDLLLHGFTVGLQVNF